MAASFFSFNSEVRRAFDRVRHAVLASGGAASDMGNEALEPAIHLAIRVPAGRGHLRKRPHHLRPALHDEDTVRYEAEIFRDRLEMLLEFR
jgi:hypothetical protein